MPVVDASRVVGIVTNRDLRFESNLDQPVKNIMTPRDRLVTVKEGVSSEEAMRLLHQHRLERVLVVNENFELRGLITVKDILKSSEHPYASKDQLGRLRVGAAVGVGEGTEERVELSWSKPAWTCWSSTPRTATRRAFWTACAGSSARFPLPRSSAATLPPPRGQGAARSGRGWRQGRHRPGFDLHDTHRRRGGRTSDYRDQQRRRRR